MGSIRQRTHGVESAIGLVASRFLKASSRDRYQAARQVASGGANEQALGGRMLPDGYAAQNG